jgi:pimeloyl-ACP methyl ester carboxylesterase
MSFLNQIHYQILGKPSEKVPLVFLHGLMGYALNWRKIANAFEGDRQVLIYDQRGHGKSFKLNFGGPRLDPS